VSVLKGPLIGLSKRRRVWALAAGVCGAVWGTSWAAPVTNLQVQFRKGQTFLTFTEAAGATLIYSIYRSPQPITSLAGLTPIAALTQGSGLNQYTGTPFIITDLGSPLPSGTGLLVWTASQSGSFYYAVTHSQDASLNPGTNSLTTPVTETVWETPGAVQLKATYNSNGPGTNRITEYFAWEDYAGWDHARWPYYGHRYDVVTQPSLLAGTQYPLILSLHGHDGTGYKEPVWDAQNPMPEGSGVFIFPRDNNYQFVADPYCGCNQPSTFWYGYQRSNGVTTDNTERRLIRYVTLTKEDPQFQIDPTRVYVTGRSLGGGGSMHLAYHYPDVFAAAAPGTGWVDPVSVSGALNFSPYLGSMTENGTSWNNWNDQTWQVTNRSPLAPPILYGFAKDDNIVPAFPYPNLLTQTEARHNAYFALWNNGGHGAAFPFPGHINVGRFRLNEAYPAFAQTGNSDAVTAEEGQRNLKLDWGSSLHSLGTGTGISDSAGAFAMSFKSLEGDTTADVTFRNTQQFRPAAGQSVQWRSALQSDDSTLQSGTLTVNGQGLMTITGLQIKAAGNRVTLSASGGPPPISPCDVNGNGSTNVTDVQLCANQAIGVSACAAGDVNGDGQCSVVDVQRVVNAALGGQCN
jgi:dienelactone hydrolase